MTGHHFSGATEEVFGEAQPDLETLAGVGMWVADLSFHHSHWSAGLRSIVGLEPTASPPSPSSFLTMVHGDDRRRVTEPLLHPLDHEGVTLEFRLVRRDGASVHLHLGTHVVRGPDGQVTVYRIVHDITAAGELRDQLTAERDRAAVVLSALPEAYLFHQLGVVLEVSDEVLALTGFGRSEILGSCPPPFFAKEDRQGWVGLQSPVEAVAPRETVLYRKDGSCFPAVASTRPARGSAGSVCGFVTTLRELAVTARPAGEALAHTTGPSTT